MTSATARALPAPRDSRLLGLRAALSDDAAELLARDVVRPEYETMSCRAVYLRYKPGQSCLVLYRLELRDERGEVRDHLVHLRLYARDRFDRVWARGHAQELAARLSTALPLRPVVRIEPLAAIAQAFPVDVDLPALVALRANRPLRYKPARKALLVDGGRFLKVYADERGARAFAAGRALAAARAPVVEPTRYYPRLRALVQPARPGVPLSAFRGSAEYRVAAAEAAAALARVHAVPVAGLSLHEWERDLDGAVSAVAAARPDLAAKARRIARDAARVLGPARHPATLHGDFYDDQVLTSPAGAVVLDFDRVAAGDPLFDVATFAARLIVEGQEPAWFVDAYAHASARPLERSHVAAAEAAAVLKLAAQPFRILEPCWPEEVERRLELAQERLRAASRRAVAVPRDPALPQLEVLLNARRAKSLLSELLERPADIADAEVVRYRPGRRATVRYTLDSGTVFAKTYASDRAPRVHRALTRLSNASRGVTLPAPLGLSEPLHLVVTAQVTGEPVVPRLLSGDVKLAERIAERLAALHASDARLERRHTAADELAAVERRIPDLPFDLREDARRSLAHTGAAAVGAPWRFRPVHRDFYPDQVRADGGSIGFLDLDDAAMSDPAVDVANFLAHLRLLALERPDDAPALTRVSRAFAETASANDPELDAALVDALEATTLVRLACIHAGEGEDLAELLLAAAENVEARS